MTNDRLRTSMSSAGLSAEALARAAGVDPKTVQRWIAGRIPHPRHRFAVVEQLHEEEEFLWPGVSRADSDGLGDAAEILAAYPHRSQAGATRWWKLITQAERQIDLLGYTLYFLPQQHPDLVALLLEKCQRGCQLRIAIADPESQHVRDRDEEEGEPITLVARIRSSLRAFEPLRDCPGAEFRFQDAPLYNSVFRFDYQMFVTPMLYGTPGHLAPLLHLRRLGPNGLFSQFASHFDGIWAASAPVRQDQGKPG